MTPARALAAAQTTPTRGDVDANVRQHLRLVQMAAKQQAKVLVFPELSLTGYELDLAAELAFSEDDPRLAPLVEASSLNSMILVVGAPVKIQGQLHIGAFIISPERGLEIYTKHHLGTFSPGANIDGDLPPAEATIFRPGDLNPLIDLEGQTAAVAVCADVGHAAHARKAARRGATTYLASMFVVPSEYEREVANLRAYAERHSMAVVLANYGGPSGGLAAAGRSAIWSAGGKLLARLGRESAGTVAAVEGPAGWRVDSAAVGAS